MPDCFPDNNFEGERINIMPLTRTADTVLRFCWNLYILT